MSKPTLTVEEMDIILKHVELTCGMSLQATLADNQLLPHKERRKALAEYKKARDDLVKNRKKAAKLYKETPLEDRIKDASN